jgi:DNA-binding NarL/FixJ family response regulator
LPVIVGRAHETALIAQCLDMAWRGEGQVVVLSGEPGIGKTRLAQYAVEQATARDMRYLWGRASELEGTPPYWMFRQIVRDAATDELLSELGSVGVDLGVVTAEAGDDATSARSGDRFLVFEAVTELLRRWAQADGSVVVLDDVHWADPASIQLLTHLVRGNDQSRLALVLTYRNAEANTRAELAQTLADLAREPAVTRLRLVGLTRTEVAEQLETVTGRAIDAATVGLVNRRTLGNPFFVTELGVLLREDPDAAAQLPDAVRAVVSRRLGQLDPVSQRLVSIAAVLGESADETALADVAEQPLVAVLETVDAAVRAGILTGPGRFTHDLVAEVARDRLPRQERLDVHARTAAHLASRADSGSRAVEIAQHWLDSLPAGDPRQAVAWAERAARRASELMAWEQAATLLGRAVAVASGPGFDPTERGRLLQAQARALLQAYDVGAALDAALAAADVAREAGDTRALVQAALTLEGFTDSVRQDERQALCEEALAVLADREVALRARLLAQLAVHMQLAEPQARDLSQEALAAAEEAGEPVAMAVAMEARQLSCSGPGGVYERLTLGDRRLALGTSLGDHQGALWGRLWRFDALLQLGQIDSAAAEIAPMTALAEHLRLPLPRWHVLRSRAALAYGRGRFDQAAELTGEVLAQSQRGGHGGGVIGAQLVTILIRAQTGAELPAGVFSEAGARRLLSGLSAAVAHWCLAAGDLDQAQRLYAELPPADQVPAFVLLNMLSSKAELAAALGDRVGARDAYERMTPYADLFICGGAGAVVVDGSAQLALGMAAATLDRLDAAAEHLRKAVVANDRARLDPHTARSRLELARVLARRRRPGDFDEAAALVTVVLSEAQRMGMAPLVRWSRELAGTLDGPGPLTKREREVAGLVAQGLTNRQIAAASYISERTVEGHVQHCLTKLGLHTRTQLAAWVAANTYRT